MSYFWRVLFCCIVWFQKISIPYPQMVLPIGVSHPLGRNTRKFNNDQAGISEQYKLNSTNKSISRSQSGEDWESLRCLACRTRRAQYVLRKATEARTKLLQLEAIRQTAIVTTRHVKPWTLGASNISEAIRLLHFLTDFYSSSFVVQIIKKDQAH